MNIDTTDNGAWVTLKLNPMYEIYDQPPYYLRRGDTIFKPSLSSNSGYAVYHLKGIDETLHHRIIAIQFCDNDDPEHKTVVNHIDGDYTNNSKSNLEWLTQSDNVKQRAKYSQQGCVKTNDLPPNAICLGEYEGRSYSRYYVVDNGLIMLCKRGKLKYKHVNASPYRQGGHSMVTLYDDNGGKAVRGLTKLLKHVNDKARACSV